MKTLIIYQSVHHGNTEKVAWKMGEVLGAVLKNPSEVKLEDLEEYDLIGFGSGIYFGRFHASMLKLVESLPRMNGKKAFIFCTYGAGYRNWLKFFAMKLDEKNFKILSWFKCRGWDTVGPLALFGGIGKGRPNEDDLAKAEDFAKNLIS